MIYLEILTICIFLIIMQKHNYCRKKEISLLKKDLTSRISFVEAAQNTDRSVLDDNQKGIENELSSLKVKFSELSESVVEMQKEVIGLKTKNKDTENIKQKIKK